MEDALCRIIQNRNACWASNPLVPSWVNPDTVGLDQFYTRPEIAQKCYRSLVDFLSKKDVKLENCEFIEPSCGAGAFYDLLPISQRLGMDLVPDSSEIMQQDFLSWKPTPTNKKRIFVGNPPFGYRAWLALSFMNHAAESADYIGFILPMAFQSDGKGSPKHRVKGMVLKQSELIPSDSFIHADGKIRKVNALWQIWEKGENQAPQRASCRQWLDLFTVDMRKERLCGQEKIGHADFFLQRTYYSQPPKLVKDFSEVKYVCGYGLIIKKEYKRVINILRNTDWRKYSNLAAHNCRHISMYHIEKALTDRGLCDAH